MEYKVTWIWMVFVILIAGCIGETTKTSETKLSDKYLLVVTDDLGRNVTITNKPERIISTSPSNTEILFALGLGDKVVGVTDYCNYPPEALEKGKIGGFSTVNIETIISLQPDLVLASDKTGEENIRKLENFGVPVIVLHPTNIEGALRNIELVGEITGVKESASKLVMDLKERIGAIRHLKEKPKVLYVVWHDPLMSAGKETFADDLIKRAGGINIADFTGYKVISLEVVVSENPDVIIVGLGHGDAGNKTLEYVMNGERLEGTNAIKNGRVYGINTDLTGRAGPRIVYALEKFAEWIQK